MALFLFIFSLLLIYVHILNTSILHTLLCIPNYFRSGVADRVHHCFPIAHMCCKIWDYETKFGFGVSMRIGKVIYRLYHSMSRGIFQYLSGAI